MPNHRLDDASGLVQALRKRSLKPNGVYGVKFCPDKVRTLFKTLQERSTVLTEKWRRLFDGFWLGVCYGAQVKQIPSLGLVSAVQHFLCDDFGAGLKFDVASSIRPDIKRLIAEGRWRS